MEYGSQIKWSLENLNTFTIRPAIEKLYIFIFRASLYYLTLRLQQPNSNEWSVCLKFSLRKPYMMGLEHTEVIADRWQNAKTISIIFVSSSSLLSNGSKMSRTILKILRGAQDRKNITVTMINILLNTNIATKRDK